MEFAPRFINCLLKAMRKIERQRGWDVETKRSEGCVKKKLKSRGEEKLYLLFILIV